MQTLKLSLGFALALSCSAAFADSKANIEGSSLKIIEIQPANTTGLNNLFVVYNTAGCSFRFKASNGYTATVYRYSNLGGGYAEEVRDVDRDASSLSFPLSSSDMGYIIEEGTNRYYCWVVNYANHVMTVNGLYPSDEPNCDYSVLRFEGNASPIVFYSINGQPVTLGRDINVEYTTEEFDETIQDYTETAVAKILESVGSTISLTPPAYCSTSFILSGDRFLQEWGMGLTAESARIQPVAVDCTTEAIQEENSSDESGSNIIHGDDSGLGGSAPANISFYAYTTEGVLHYEWQMSRNQDFENPEYRFYQQNLDHTFTEEGTYYLRFIGSNADGSCETFGETYTVSIGASALECPNAFSPNDDGVNDIWKVSYRSLIDFHCEIFNRNGQKIYGFDDPSGGWDGTWHGKKVKPGVYYYVIIATGADGEKYKKSGDINIINSVNYGTGSGGSSDSFDPTE